MQAMEERRAKITPVAKKQKPLKVKPAAQTILDKLLPLACSGKASAKLSGASYENKTSSRKFADGRARRADGRFGKDKKSSKLTGKPLFSYDLEIERFPYDVLESFSVNISLSKTGFNLSGKLTSPDLFSYKLPVNQSLTTLVSKSSDAILKFFDFDNSDSKQQHANDSWDIIQKIALVKDILEGIGFVGEGIIVKQFAFETQSEVSGGVGLDLGKQKNFSLGAGAKIGSIKLILETPIGEISVAVKAGLALGKRSGKTFTKKGKPGKYSEQSWSFGPVEISFNPDVSALLKDFCATSH